MSLSRASGAISNQNRYEWLVSTGRFHVVQWWCGLCVASARLQTINFRYFSTDWLLLLEKTTKTVVHSNCNYWPNSRERALQLSRSFLSIASEERITIGMIRKGLNTPKWEHQVQHRSIEHLRSARSARFIWLVELKASLHAWYSTENVQ